MYNILYTVYTHTHRYNVYAVYISFIDLCLYIAGHCAWHVDSLSEHVLNVWVPALLCHADGVAT